MLNSVQKVREEVVKHCKTPPFSLEVITNVIKAYTAIDTLYFARYDTPPENPIWGEFTRWIEQPGPYRSLETKVEIRYASHLLDSEDWLRLIVCKELCHSLEVSEGSHDVSVRAIDNLVASFSLLSARQSVGKLSVPYHLEILAEVCALELLCPLTMRNEIVAAHGIPDDGACVDIAKEFHIPLEYVVAGFTPDHMEAIGVLFAKP